MHTSITMVILLSTEFHSKLQSLHSLFASLTSVPTLYGHHSMCHPLLVCFAFSVPSTSSDLASAWLALNTDMSPDNEHHPSSLSTSVYLWDPSNFVKSYKVGNLVRLISAPSAHTNSQHLISLLRRWAAICGTLPRWTKVQDNLLQESLPRNSTASYFMAITIVHKTELNRLAPVRSEAASPCVGKTWLFYKG